MNVQFDIIISDPVYEIYVNLFKSRGFILNIHELLKNKHEYNRLSTDTKYEEDVVFHVRMDSDFKSKSVSWDRIVFASKNAYDSTTQLGEIIKLLDKPVPVAPEIQGAKVLFRKGQESITIGYGNISIPLLRTIRNVMNTKWENLNCKLTGIIMNGGNPLSLTNIQALLTYVDEVNSW